MENFRNSLHIFIGFSLMYTIGNLTYFSTYTLNSKIFGCTLASLVIGGALGAGWEWLQSLKNPKNFDKYDVMRTAIGSLLGGVLAIFYPNLDLLMYTTCSISLIIILTECVIIYNTKK
tara:strand:- start:48936 stop:49289 length:354 start_codon:yes stop_codon:yes gene_type:complete